MAANSSISPVLDEISLNGVATSAALNQTFFEKLAGTPAVLLQHKDLLALEARIIATALACIYIGAHGSLRRPPSAKSPKADKDGKKKTGERDDQYVQGLLPSDAILFPIMAGTVLVGLYYLIKWLEDPNILNKILRVYFSIMSLASLGKLFADGLHFLTSFVFPTVWIDYSGKVYHIDSDKRGQWYSGSSASEKVWDREKLSPLPGLLSRLRLSNKTTGFLWAIRRLFLEEWTVRLAVHGIINETVKVQFNDIFGVMLAIGTNAIYYTTESLLISNIMGYAISYAGIILMSPTTFATGSSVLFGLFFYDIVMVFYT